MKNLKLLICILPLALGLSSCNSDDEEAPVKPTQKWDTGKNGDSKQEEEEEGYTIDPEELLTKTSIQWVSASDATLYWEISENYLELLKENNIQASYGIAWSQMEEAVIPVDNQFYTNTENISFGQGTQAMFRLVSLMRGTTYYYVTYVILNGELTTAPIKSFTTMTEDISTGQTPEGVRPIDMGLPSGTMWANMNIGAVKPEDAGLYFAWGETEGFVADGSDDHLFGWGTYKLCNGSRATQTKYCTTGSYGTADGRIVLEFTDDAAYVNWGTEWRMPTGEDMIELMENTTNEWTTVNGVGGYRFISEATGNTIFLPAAGCRVSESHYEDGTDCYYWASSVDREKPYASRYLRFYAGRMFVASLFRYYGMNIRPVHR